MFCQTPQLSVSFHLLVLVCCLTSLPYCQKNVVILVYSSLQSIIYFYPPGFCFHNFKTLISVQCHLEQYLTCKLMTKKLNKGIERFCIFFVSYFRGYLVRRFQYLLINKTFLDLCQPKISDRYYWYCGIPINLGSSGWVLW